MGWPLQSSGHVACVRHVLSVCGFGQAYEMGVGLDVRLTRLYEYYLYAMPDDREGELPQEIYLYFAYTNTLDDRSRALHQEHWVRWFVILGRWNGQQMYMCPHEAINRYSIGQMLLMPAGELILYKH